MKSNFTVFAPKHRGFSLVEMLIALTALGVVVSVALPIYSKATTNSGEMKIRSDAKTVNRAILSYIASGGSMDGVKTPEQALAKLRSSRSEENAWTYVGAGTGSFVDERLMFRTLPDDRKAGILWNASEQRFEVIEQATADWGEFVLGTAGEREKVIEQRADSALVFAESGWIWEHDSSMPDRPPGPDSFPLGTGSYASGPPLPGPLLPPPAAGPPLSNLPPTAIDDTFSTREDQALGSSLVLDNDFDPDGDTINVTASSPPTGGGSFSVAADGTVSYLPPPNFSGTVNFTYTVTDSNGGYDIGNGTIEVTPVNDAPVAEDDKANTLKGIPVTIDVLANDTDIEGDSLRVSTAVASVGTVTVNANNTLTFNPPAGYQGIAAINYTVDDGNGGLDDAVATVVVRNGKSSLGAGWWQDAVHRGVDIYVNRGYFSGATNLTAGPGLRTRYERLGGATTYEISNVSSRSLPQARARGEYLTTTLTRKGSGSAVIALTGFNSNPAWQGSAKIALAVVNPRGIETILFQNVNLRKSAVRKSFAGYPLQAGSVYKLRLYVYNVSGGARGSVNLDNPNIKVTN